jgi:hypothetical protein
MFRLISVLTVFVLILAVRIPIAYCKEVITIIPCSSNHNNPKFFDTPSYFTQKGQPISWYNADDVDHRIVITTADRKELLSDSGVIKPNGSYIFKFNNVGYYHFSSPVYPWMQGNVSVTSDISSVTLANRKNNVEVQLAWTPSLPGDQAVSPGEITHFKIIFIDKKTNNNQKHIDYIFSIDTRQNKTLYHQTLHSSCGVESASYKFSNGGIFNHKLTPYFFNQLNRLRKTSSKGMILLYERPH